MSGTADGELQRKIEEYRARERVYLAGLLGQEAEMGHLRQMTSNVLDAYGDTARATVRGALTYPTANMEVLTLRQKLREKDQQIALLKEELEANRFDQRLPAGQALVRKCKALLLENRELGEEIREERVADLSAALSSEQAQNEQLYQKVREASDFCKELSEENEKLQGTIAKVAGRLRESRAELEGLKTERAEAKKKRKIERESKAAAAAIKAATLQAVADEGPLGVPVGAPPPPAAGEAPPPAPAPTMCVFEQQPPPAREASPPAPAALAAAAPTLADDGGAGQKAKDKKDKKEKKDKAKKRKAVAEPEAG